MLILARQTMLPDGTKYTAFLNIPVNNGNRAGGEYPVVQHIEGTGLAVSILATCYGEIKCE